MRDKVASFTPWLIGIGIAVASAGGCSSSPASPAAPSAVAPTAGTQIEPSAARGGHPTLDEVSARGWSCRATPAGDRYNCSPPNQGFPVFGNPPPADRPATYSFLSFGADGTFVGTQLLIRTDLYAGQTCESTGAPYILRALVGYYECVHYLGE